MQGVARVRLEDFRPTPAEATLLKVDIGPMNRVCEICKARKYACEHSPKDTDCTFMCCCGPKCNRGKFARPPRMPPPLTLLKYFPGSDFSERVKWKWLKKNFRAVQASLAMAASVCTRFNLPPGGPPGVILNGQLYHTTGTINPAPGQPAQFSQMYFQSPSAAGRAQSRLNLPQFGGPDSPIRECEVHSNAEVLPMLIELEDILAGNHVFFEAAETYFRSQGDGLPHGCIDIRNPRQRVPVMFGGVYERPTAEPFAGLFVEPVPGQGPRQIYVAGAGQVRCRAYLFVDRSPSMCLGLA